jgi:hypothetical protein
MDSFPPSAHAHGASYASSLPSALTAVDGALDGRDIDTPAHLASQAAPAPARAPGSTPWDDEPPLLEELEIDLWAVWVKALRVLFPSVVCNKLGRYAEYAPAKPVEVAPNATPAEAAAQLLEDDADADLAGPLLFCLALGALLLMAGKVHFGYIYGFGLSGCALLWLVLGLMSDGLSFDRTVHIFGYCLPPVLLLAGLAPLLDARSALGQALAVGCVAWSTTSATRYAETTLDMRDQRYLLAYPIGLFYACFALMTLF